MISRVLLFCIVFFVNFSCTSVVDDIDKVSFWVDAPEHWCLHVTNNFDLTIENNYTQDSLYLVCTPEQAKLLEISEIQEGYVQLGLTHSLFIEKERPLVKIYNKLKPRIGIALHETARFISTDTLKVKNVYVATVNHADSIQFLVNNSRLTMDIHSGNSTVRLAGKTEELIINQSGMGRYDFSDLESDNVFITVKGAGNTYIGTCNYLSVDMQFSGNIYLTQKPAKIDRVGNGTGKIIVLN